MLPIFPRLGAEFFGNVAKTRGTLSCISNRLEKDLTREWTLLGGVLRSCYLLDTKDFLEVRGPPVLGYLSEHLFCRESPPSTVDRPPIPVPIKSIALA